MVRTADAWAARDGQPLRAMRTIAAFGRDSMHQLGHDAAADAAADAGQTTIHRDRRERRQIDSLLQHPTRTHHNIVLSFADRQNMFAAPIVRPPRSTLPLHITNFAPLIRARRTVGGRARRAPRCDNCLIRLPRSLPLLPPSRPPPEPRGIRSRPFLGKS